MISSMKKRMKVAKIMDETLPDRLVRTKETPFLTETTSET